ncbi:hypothetical protein B0T20DRAFT_365074 [Sordaria brevicollis]|uniref:DNA-directed RNA polymerase subunit n=1 Tax=Sordaria brevicollis TaxID=83679 RepID=A0AAE0NV95_SORBR|nr:hypothetical protein B0T20DRAFT_365074 [Sordaria brevicollis]
MSQSVVDSPPPTKAEKKHKKDKKRSRDEADDEVPAVDVEDAPKKHKKSKSESLDTEKKSKKSKKSKKEDVAEEVVAEEEEEQAPAKKEKKKKSKKNKEEPVVEEEEQEQEQEEEAAVASEPEDKKKQQRQASAIPEPTTDAMDIDTTLPTGNDDDADFPFYTQTHSLYVPFYPCGFDKPLTNIAQQHLEPLLNHYSPVLRGVLLSYTNLNLSERPVQASVINPPTDETPALLRSVDEYAVGFAYLTFDAHMFKPARGKSMEGVIQMQSEGHIGVQCWGRFNASIEAKRLPKGWKWHDLKGDNHNNNGSRSHIHFDDEDEEQQQEEAAEQEEEEEEDQLDGEELQVVEQMHTTGYWTDASGKKISGKVRFRIKNFDVGLAGDYGYLSLEGTFLSDEEERALQKEERELERKRRSRQNPGGLLRPMSRRVPEFSMTRFGKEEEEEDAGKRTVFAKVTGKEGDVTPDD